MCLAVPLQVEAAILVHFRHQRGKHAAPILICHTIKFSPLAPLLPLWDNRGLYTLTYKVYSVSGLHPALVASWIELPSPAPELDDTVIF